MMTASHAIPAQAGLPLDADRPITSQPIGHYEFCQKYKDECEVKSRSVMPPKVTDHGWPIIREVNATVNRTITPMTDLELNGRDEVWAYPTTAGDCEDMALLKRKKLMEKGFSCQRPLDDRGAQAGR